MHARRFATLTLLVTALLTLCAGFSRPSAATPLPVQPTIGAVALQLGLRLPQGESSAFDVGISFTSLLEKPELLSRFGVADMKPGARVVAARIALGVVIVEADQPEPARVARVKLAIDAAGRLSAAPRS